MHRFVHPFKSQLARKLAVLVIIASSSVAFFASAYQLYSNYQQQLSTIDRRIDDIKKTQVSNIASRLWVLDKTALKDNMSAILSLPAIDHIAVYDQKKLFLEVGTKTKDQSTSYRFPLTYEYRGKQQDLGYMTITTTLDEVYSTILNQAINILASNLIKTYIVSILILFIFYHTIIKHLRDISSFAQSMTNDNLKRIFSFTNKPQSSKKDELDQLADAINAMQSRLKKAFDLSQQREIDLSITMDSIGDGVIVTDHKGKITRMNPVAHELTGWSIESAYGQKLEDVFQITDTLTQQKIPSPADKVLATREIITLANHTSLTTKNGQVIHIADSAAPIINSNDELTGVILVFHDVSKQYQLRQSLEQKRLQLQGILDHSPASIFAKDKEGNYLFYNKEFMRINKVKGNELIGQSNNKIFEPNKVDEFNKIDQRVLLTGKAVISEHQIVIERQLKTFLTTKFPLYDQQSEIYAVCGIATDITQRTQKENSLKRSQKLDALGKLTSGISHDFNNILGIILGYSEILHEELNDDEHLQSLTHEISQAAERGSQLINKLLSLTKHRKLHFENIDLNALIQSQKTLLSKTLTPSIELRTNTQKDLWPIKISAADLEMVILNLSINSMHAMPKGGEITFSTQNISLKSEQSKTLDLAPGDYVTLSVKDNGTGIDHKIIELIFDPFFTTKGKKGTGLGLNQVYNSIRDYKGSVEVKSQPNHGTEFILYIPRSYETLTFDKTRIGQPEFLNGHEKILVVDDEPAIRSMVRSILNKHGYHAETASSGSEALEYLKEQSFDLLLSDILMPKMNGYQLAQHVQQNYPKVKIQLMTGFDDIDKVNKQDRELFENCLHKPISTNELLTQLRKVLDTKYRIH
ncbi:MAG: PAS domain-containing protein [bacterium]